MVVGGCQWVGEGVRSVGSVIVEMIDSAEKELLLTVYILSSYDVIEHIHHALARGVSVRVIMNSPDNQMPVVQKLRDLENEYPYIGIMGVTDTMMHARVMVADRKTVLVGSVNLSISRMTKNYEMGLLVRNDEVAQQVEAILLRIWGK